MNARAPKMIDRLHALDELLAAKGFPRLSAWWRRTLAAFYISEKRQLVLRVGRRGGKSTSLCRVAVVEGLYGEHAIPPGDVGVVAFISTTRDEAAQRLRTIRAILDALGVTYKPIDGGIELTDRPIVFKVFTASIAGVSGFTAICIICDEVAKWKDADTGANPAREVLGSVRPTLATQPHAKIFLSSSPMSTVDAHYDAFEAGETPQQLTAYAPTWEANPTVSQEETRILEPDARVWAREYKAIPQAAVCAAFDPELVDSAFRPPPAGVDCYGRPAMIIDPSSGRGDAFTHAYVQWHTPEVPREAFMFGPDRLDPRGNRILHTAEVLVDDHGVPLIKPEWQRRVRRTLVVNQIGAWEGRFFGHTSLDDIVAVLARDARDTGANVWSDQRENYALEAAFRRHGVRFESIPWTNVEKATAVERLRRLFAEKTIALPVGDDALKRELHSFEEKTLPSGTITFGARRSGHDDRVALLITACMADAVGGIPMSPMALAIGRNVDARMAERRP